MWGIGMDRLITRDRERLLFHAGHSDDAAADPGLAAPERVQAAFSAALELRDGRPWLAAAAMFSRTWLVTSLSIPRAPLGRLRASPASLLKTVRGRLLYCSSKMLQML